MGYYSGADVAAPAPRNGVSVRCRMPTDTAAGSDPRTGDDESNGKEALDDVEDPLARSPVQKVTVRMPRDQVEDLDDLVDETDFRSRSAAIRAGASVILERGGA